MRLVLVSNIAYEALLALCPLVRLHLPIFYRCEQDTDFGLWPTSRYCPNGNVKGLPLLCLDSPCPTPQQITTPSVTTLWAWSWGVVSMDRASRLSLMDIQCQRRAQLHGLRPLRICMICYTAPPSLLWYKILPLKKDGYHTCVLLVTMAFIFFIFLSFHHPSLSLMEDGCWIHLHFPHKDLNL